MPAVKKLKRVSYIIPSFAVRASSNTKCDPNFLGGRQLSFADGVHILDLVLECLQGVFSRNACRMREQLCQIDHALITRMPFGRFLVSVLPRVIRLTLCLHLFQALADVLRINHTIKQIHLDHNQIGDVGVKVWWVERCGVSPGSCVRLDSG